MNKPAILLLLITCLGITGLAQNKKTIDSLVKILPAITNDSAKARALNRISLFYTKANTDSALKYAAMGLMVSKTMNWQRGIGAFYTCFGNAYSTKALYDSAIYYYNACLLINVKMKDSPNIASTYNNIGAVYSSKGDYVNAIKNYILTLKISEAINFKYYTGLAMANIGNTYYYQKNYSEALHWAKKSLIMRLSDDEYPELIPDSYALLGMTFREKKEYDSAFKYLRLAEKIEKSNGNLTAEASALTNIAQTYKLKNELDSAIKYAEQAQTIWNKVDPHFETALENTGLLGYCYLQQHKELNKNTNSNSPQLIKAKKQLTAAIEQAIKQNNRGIYSELLPFLSEVCSLSHDYKNAYLLYKQFKEMQDSIYSQENKNTIAASISQLEIDKKNSELELKNFTIAAQKKQKTAYIAGLCALAVIGGLLFYQNKLRKKTNTTLLKLNTELDEANKVKAKFFGILSHDLRTPVANLVNYLHLQKNAPDLLSAQAAEEQQKKISRSAENLLETMETMLLWSKQQMQQFKPNIQQLPVDQLFDYLEQFFSTTEQVRLEFSMQPGLTVSSDENYLKAIMQNLTSNAIKALSKTPNATIKWKAWAENGQTYISVTDNGPGLSGQQIKPLFKDEVTSNAKTGFGLHIIRDLAKAVHCSISVTNLPQGGVQFILTT